MKIEEFWLCVKKGKKDECWPWLRGRTGLGYGQFCHDGIVEYAHRVAARLSGMKIEGVVVMHSCDNPPCCNPRHVGPATQQQNMHDKIKKGRANMPCGEHHHRTKVRQIDVDIIRALYAKGITQNELGKRYGMSRRGIGAIVNRETWK